MIFNWFNKRNEANKVSVRKKPTRRYEGRFALSLAATIKVALRTTPLTLCIRHTIAALRIARMTVVLRRAVLRTAVAEVTAAVAVAGATNEPSRRSILGYYGFRLFNLVTWPNLPSIQGYKR